MGLLCYNFQFVYILWFVFMNIFDNVRSNVISSSSSIKHISRQGIYCTIFVFVFDNICRIIFCFGKMVSLYKISTVCWYASMSITTTVLPLSTFVIINYFLLALYEFVNLNIIVHKITFLWCISLIWPISTLSVSGFVSFYFKF